MDGRHLRVTAVPAFGRDGAATAKSGEIPALSRNGRAPLGEPDRLSLPLPGPRGRDDCEIDDHVSVLGEPDETIGPTGGVPSPGRGGGVGQLRCYRQL